MTKHIVYDGTATIEEGEDETARGEGGLGSTGRSTEGELLRQVNLGMGWVGDDH